MTDDSHTVPGAVAWRNRVPLSIMGGISYAFRVESPKGLPDASDWEPLYTDPTFVEMPAIRAATEAEEDLLRQRTELKAELAECKALLKEASAWVSPSFSNLHTRIDAALKDKP